MYADIAEHGGNCTILMHAFPEQPALTLTYAVTSFRVFVLHSLLINLKPCRPYLLFPSIISLNLSSPLLSSLAKSSKMDSKERQHHSEPLALREDSNALQASPDASSSEKQQDDSQPPTPPNGGFMAWLQVAGAWTIMFNVLGLLNSYGQFQNIYESDLLKNESASTIAWIGSAQFLVCYLVCIFTGPLLDTGHLHILLAIGTVVTVFGLMMVSLCHSYYQFFLAQTIVTGIGFGLIFLPASSVVSQWFSTRTPLAIGISVSGSSIGKSMVLWERNAELSLLQVLSYTP